MIKVLVADDQELIRESLKAVLNDQLDINVIGTAQNGQEVLELVKKTKPDIILMDVRMPIIDGVQCTKIIKQSHPNIKIIILTTFDDDKYLSDAIKFGAQGYLLKGESIKDIVSAIRQTYEGNITLSQQAIQMLVKIYSNLANSRFNALAEEEYVYEGLTKTEMKILQEIGKGKSNKEISVDLHLSEGTVRNNLSIILAKLDLRDRMQLAIWVMQHKKGVKKDDIEE